MPEQPLQNSMLEDDYLLLRERRQAMVSTGEQVSVSVVNQWLTTVQTQPVAETT